MNINDSEKVAGLMLADGYEQADRADEADVVFVNTCAVRERAAEKLYHAVGRLKRLKARRPGLLVGVGGCVPQLQGASILDRARAVDVLVGTHNVAEVPALFQRCDVYVQLSRHEGSPLSLNDALVLGKPAIVSDQVGTISHTEIARLKHLKIIEPTIPKAAVAIAEAISDLDGLKAAARDAHPVLQDFLSWDRVARLHLQEYESLVTEGAVPSLQGK